MILNCSPKIGQTVFANLTNTLFFLMVHWSKNRTLLALMSSFQIYNINTNFEGGAADSNMLLPGRCGEILLDWHECCLILIQDLDFMKELAYGKRPSRGRSEG